MSNTTNHAGGTRSVGAVNSVNSIASSVQTATSFTVSRASPSGSTAELSHRDAPLWHRTRKTAAPSADRIGSGGLPMPPNAQAANRHAGTATSNAERLIKRPESPSGTLTSRMMERTSAAQTAATVHRDGGAGAEGLGSAEFCVGHDSACWRCVCRVSLASSTEFFEGRRAPVRRPLPIRLTPMTATCRVPPLSRVKLGIGWSRGVARDAEQ